MLKLAPKTFHLNIWSERDRERETPTVGSPGRGRGAALGMAALEEEPRRGGAAPGRGLAVGMAVSEATRAGGVAAPCRGEGPRWRSGGTPGGEGEGRGRRTRKLGRRRKVGEGKCIMKERFARSLACGKEFPYRGPEVWRQRLEELD